MKIIANIFTEFMALSYAGFLGCIAATGVFGGMTAKTSILFIQALPTALSLGAVFLASVSQQASPAEE